MKRIYTAADVACLSDMDKDYVFAFDTARGRLRTSMIRTLLIPLLLITGSLVSVSSGPKEGVDWVLSASVWLGFLGGAMGVLGILLFSGNLKGDYLAMQAAKRLLSERGLDASKICSDDIWTGLFTPQKEG